MLSAGLSLFNKAEEVSLTLSEPFLDGFNRILRKLLVLYHKVMKIISEVIGAGRPTMAIENTEEADLRPVNVKRGLVLWLQYIQYDGDPVLIVVTDDTLIRVGGVRLDDPALLLARFGRLVVLQLNCFGV